MSEVLITTLVENTVNTGGLRGEHGLSFLIRSGYAKILFDTGASDLFAHNARAMGLSLEDLKALVLSHGHYDHTGGIAELCRAGRPQKIYTHAAALEPKFSLNADGTNRYVGMPEESVRALRSRSAADKSSMVWTREPQEICNGIWVTGEIPRQNDFEDVGGRFFQDAACAHPDPLRDDQAVFFQTLRGVVVVLGCAHAGVVNTLEHISAFTGGKPFWAVIGGMHLLNASPERMRCTLEALSRWDIGKVIPCHCTGALAAAKLWSAFPERFAQCPVGTTIKFPT